MINSIGFDLFTDGYNVDQINCIDLTTAVASSNNNYNNYYYYCFLYCVSVNWPNNNQSDMLTCKNNILNKLGLTLKFKTIEDQDQLIPFIQQTIDKKQPLILITGINALFYDFRYRTDTTVGHAIIISGYDDERSLIIIRDNTTREIGGQLKKITRAKSLFEFQITEGMLLDIWNISNTDFKIRNNLTYYNNIFVIENNGEVQIKNYYDLIKYFINNFKFNNNPLINIINNFNESIDIIDDEFVSGLRNKYVNSFEILFDGFERTFRYARYDVDKLMQLNAFKEKFINFRSTLIAKLHKYKLIKRELSHVEKNKMINELNEMDNGLFNMAQSIYSEKIDSLKKNVYTFVDLTQYFDNQAFGDSISLDCKANLRGTGFYILMNDIKDEIIWQLNEMKFDMSHINGYSFDNISCSNQVISVPNDCYKSIMLLGNGVYESYIGLPSYTGQMLVCYSDGEVDEISISFSDIHRLPVCGEAVVRKCQFGAKPIERPEIFNTNIYFFGQSYALKHSDKQVESIKLPNNSYIRLFSITLCK